MHSLYRSACTSRVRGGRKSHRGWDAILERMGVIFEGREIRIQVSGFVSCAPHSGRNTMGEHSGNNAARDMRGLGRGSPPIRGDLLAEFQQREREGSRERTASGIREMQIKGKFSATRTNFAVYVSAFLGTTTVALLRFERKREKDRGEWQRRNLVRKLEMCDGTRDARRKIVFEYGSRWSVRKRRELY